MSPTSFSYTRVPKSTALFLDYLYQFERVQKFYGASPPFELTSYQEVAQKISGRRDRNSLVELLTRQNQALGCSEAALANVRRLRDPGTLAVVTGQQVGLFSGPAFTIYKALTAVRLAQFLAEKGLPCIPVFWLATEDHDLEEVGHAAVLSEGGEMVSLSDSGTGAAQRSSVGYIELSSQVTAALDRLEQALPAGEPRDRLLLDLRETYTPGARWGEAFGRFMARLFSRFGVVMIDPLNDDLHQLARTGYERALREASSLRKLLQNRSKELSESGYHAQVHVGDDSTLLFAMRDGSRAAIRQRDSEFYLEGAEATDIASIERWIASRPLDFSPSALLRPVIQDTMLPTVAYVAGPAELAYFGQAQVLYPEFGRPMPVIFPRAGFTLADHRLGRLLEKYELSLEDVWKGEEHLRRRIAVAGVESDGCQPRAAALGDSSENSGQPDSRLDDPDPASPAAMARVRENVPAAVSSLEGWAARLDQAEGNLRRLLEGLREDVQVIDPTLRDAISHGEEKIVYQIGRLKGKISRAVIERSEVLQRHERDLIRFLSPAGNLQEREISGIYFLACAGYELLDRLLPEIQTAAAEHRFFIY
jgi:bacillithiol biosynthesis cysteine-adding enzyme BshC